jgi:hypothetical protein
VLTKSKNHCNEDEKTEKSAARKKIKNDVKSDLN